MSEQTATEDTGEVLLGAALIALALVGTYYIANVAWRTVRRLMPKK